MLAPILIRYYRFGEGSQVLRRLESRSSSLQEPNKGSGRAAAVLCGYRFWGARGGERSVFARHAAREQKRHLIRVACPSGTVGIVRQVVSRRAPWQKFDAVVN
jgi:hypothetical protein